jgi:hypothetical protein
MAGWTSPRSSSYTIRANPIINFVIASNKKPPKIILWFMHNF